MLKSLQQINSPIVGQIVAWHKMAIAVKFATGSACAYSFSDAHFSDDADDLFYELHMAAQKDQSFCPWVQIVKKDEIIDVYHLLTGDCVRKELYHDPFWRISHLVLSVDEPEKLELFYDDMHNPLELL